MASSKQLQANRANAGKSTGPRTQVGKARSRLNSRKHGLTAKTLIIVGEHAEDFEELRSALIEQYDPQSALEFELLERLAGILWRLRRVPLFEAGILDARHADVSDDELERHYGELAETDDGQEEDKEVTDWKASVHLGLALLNDAARGDALGKLARHETTLMNAFTKTLQMLLLLQEKRAQSEVQDVIIEVSPPWEQNVQTVRAVSRSMRQDQLPKSGIAPQLVAHLKRCAIALVKPQGDASQDKPSVSDAQQLAGGRTRIDKSVLKIGEPKRIRCKEHLRFVASQPCLICGRSPSHAHHVRHAQARGLSLKVSDEFAVPLCATHHHHIHTTSKEREWWQDRNLDPLAAARDLWQESRQLGAHVDTASQETSNDPKHGVLVEPLLDPLGGTGG